MQRRPERELMDQADNAAAYARANFSEPHERFVTLCGERLSACVGERNVLDLGCGAADIMIRFARRFPHCRIHGVDGAPAMLALGRAAIDAAGLDARLSLAQTYLPSATLPRNAFDAIISNSLLHHLHDPAALWQSVVHAGKAGAAVFIMDLLRPASEAQARQLVETYCGDEDAILQEDFFNSLCAAYRPDEIAAQLAAAGLRTLAIEVVSDRHVIVFGYLSGA